MITLTTEQAQQIEEALEDIVRVFEFETGTPVEALATIRTARAQEQSEQEPVIRATLAPPAPPEVYQMRSKEAYEAGWWEAQRQKAVSPIAPAQQAEQEPVGIVSENVVDGVVEWLGWVPQVGTKLYTAPVRTKDLTDDEIMKINVDTASIVPTCDRQFHFARTVIAAFKEKNK